MSGGNEFYLIGMLAVAGVLSFLLRAAPFLLFGRGKEPPPVVRYLGRMLAPAVQQIAAECEGKVKVGKVNVDEEPELAQRFGIMSIPTVLVFKDGKKTASSIGLVPKAKLLALLEK